MAQRNYLQTLAQTTPTQFWNDSGEPPEIRAALANGACGVTTNPILITRTVLAHPDEWRKAVRQIAQATPVSDIAHEVTASVVLTAASMLLPLFRNSDGAAGYVCAQGNPFNYDNAQAMVDEAMAFAAIRPNIANKIPASAAGLDAVEELTSRGVTTTCTTSFTVPQVLAIAEAFRRGLARRSSTAAQRPLRSFAVLMAGRLDDHLRDEVKAGHGQASEAAIAVAGLAVCKRAYTLYNERGYESVLLVGGMRGNYHATELAGSRMVLTIAPAMQIAIIAQNYTVRSAINEPAPEELVQEIARVPDFLRAYEPDGMKPGEFAGYGAFVKTQGQFMANYEKLQEFIAESLS
jgi:transaldolase